MKKVTDFHENQPNILPKQDSIPKVLSLTSGFGGVFGLLITILVFSLNGFQGPIFLYFLGVPIFCALIAGLAGLSSLYLDRFSKKHGLTNSKKWQFIGIVIAILLAMTFGLSTAAYFGFLNVKEQLPFILTTSIIGLVFGIVITIVDERLWNMRRKVLILELKNKYLAELAEKDHRLQETAKNLIVAEERNRMARELHDSISQGIHGIIYTSHTLKQHLHPEDQKAKAILEHLITTSETTLNELRAMILELKPSLLEERGLAEALKLHCQLFAERLKIKCLLNLDQFERATPQQEMAIYRIVQEALANIQQHAEANEVNIYLTQEGTNLKLIIKDNGKGFDMEGIKHGNGLCNMESRCQENDGTLRIKSIPDQETTIEAVFPIFK